MPLPHLDFGALYNTFHGETERNLRESLASAEQLAPCMVWIDASEKGLASSTSDDGVAKRVLGTVLTRMAEHTSSVFLVATANAIDPLPPELLRKGRFDEISFVAIENRRLSRFSLAKSAHAVQKELNDARPHGTIQQESPVEFEARAEPSATKRLRNPGRCNSR